MSSIKYKKHPTKKPQYSWPMSVKHESIRDINLIYCFVHISDAEILPKFFLVPSIDVADQIKTGHANWLESNKGKVKDNPMRNFMIELADPDSYENNWDIFK